MGLTIDAKVLRVEVASLQRVVNRRSPMPALNSIHIEPRGDNCVRLTATDLEVTLTSDIYATMTGNPILLPGAKLNDMVRLLDGPVNIEKKGARVKVSCGQFTSHLLSMAESDFPLTPTVDSEAAQDMPAPMLAKMIELTKFCMGGQDVKYMLSGSLFKVDGGQATMVTTDGNRVAVINMPLDGHFGSEVISDTAIRELIELTSSGGDVKYASHDTHLWFSCGQRTVTVAKLAGTFPNYETFIPSSHEIRVDIDRLAFLNAIRRARLVATRGRHMVMVSLNDGMMRIESATSEVGDVVEDIQVAYLDDLFVFGIEGSYLDDFLSAVDTAEVRMELTDPSKGVVLMPGAPSDPEQPKVDYKNVCMPMRLPSEKERQSVVA